MDKHTRQRTYRTTRRYIQKSILLKPHSGCAWCTRQHAENLRINPYLQRVYYPRYYWIFNKIITNRKALGDDLINNIALKFASKSVILQMTQIFNSCLRKGYFPSKWKHAVIITILRKDYYHSQTSNYRPIALLSSIFQFFEKVILMKIKGATDTQIRQQFSFRKHHLTVQQFVRLVDV